MYIRDQLCQVMIFYSPEHVDFRESLTLAPDL